MYKNTMTFVKGIGAGVAVGAAAIAIGSKVMKGNKSLKKDAGKAVHAMGELISDVQSAIMKN